MNIFYENQDRTTFLPMLLNVEVSADKFNPGEVLWVTSQWQNIGGKPSGKPLQGFIEMSFGHQRILETQEKFYRTYWAPSPETYRWEKGSIWKTTCRWNINTSWNGTFKIMIGLCDLMHIPVEIVGECGKPVKQVHIGEIDVGWSWGQPRVEEQRRAWCKEFNKPLCDGDDVLECTEHQNVEVIGTYAADMKAVEIEAQIKAAFSLGKPVLRCLSDKERMFCMEGSLPEIAIRDRKSDSDMWSWQTDMKVSYTGSNKNPGKLSYQGNVFMGEESIVEFNLNFEVAGRQVVITMDGIKEKSGYELLEVRLPELVTGRNPDTSIGIFFGGGRLIPIKDAVPMGYQFNYDTRGAAGMINGDGVLAMEYFCLDDKMYVSVQEDKKGKRACLGLSLVHRVRARGNVTSIRVENEHRVEIELLDSHWGPPSWQALGRYFRRNLKGKNRDIYRRSLFYKYLLTHGPQPPPGRVVDGSPYPVKRLTAVITFKEALDRIRKYYNIFDGIHQVTYMVGFQKGGCGANFPPYVYDTDERVGSRDELVMCIREGEKYNANIGLHDNFEHCFMSPYYDARVVSMDEEGKFWKGWIWAEGQVSVIGPYKYAKMGLMQERVRKMVEIYGLHTTTHLDALTSELLRFDFDPEYPASAHKSIQGKYAIIDEFNQYGIDISSETLLHPFVGHIGHALWTRDDRERPLIYGEKYIPLLSMVYHGTIHYCGPSGNKTEFLWSLIRCSDHFMEENHCDAENIKWIYLQNMPIGLLYDKYIRDYRQEGNKFMVVFDEQTYTEVDFDTYTYEIVVDGQRIAWDWTTFVPGFKDDNGYLAYSLYGGRMEIPVPNAWRECKRLRAVTLTFEGEGAEIPCRILNNVFNIDIPEATPVKIIPVE